MTIGARIRARALRVLLAVCISIPFFAYAAGTGVTDARAVWVALSGSVLKVSPADGSVNLTLPGTPTPQGFAVGQDDESVWIYSKKSLESFDLQGNPLLSVSLPNNFHGGTPDGMAVDNSAGNIWIAIQKDLYQIDMAGAVKNDIHLSANAVGITLDPTRSRLWVAEQSGIEVFDASGTDQLSVSLSGAPVAIAYDKTLDQVWVSSSGQIARYNSNGVLVLSAPLASGLGSLIAVDGQGGLWTANGQNLGYLNSAGQIQFEAQPFAGEDGGDAVDLVADVLNHSAWVANARHLRQYALDGSFIKEATLSLPSGDGQAVQRLGIYVDTIPPTVSITAPQTGAYTNHNKPTLVLSYSDIGSGVDPATVAVISNGVNLPVTCVANADGSGASCTPNAVLPDGGYSLSITVQDKAGNTSQPATVSFTVDTVPPTITVASPASPYTNQPSFTVTGSISEAGTLTINGASVTLTATNTFSDAVTLTQGDNALAFVATDLAGNVTTITKTLNLNTIPPIPVVNGDISVAGPANGQVTISGKAGAVAPNVSVTITDTKTGQSVTVTSDATGAFIATLAAGNSDSLQIVETDQWSNVTTDPNTIAVSNLPPDPASVAPSLSTTAFTGFSDRTSFLYGGSNPIQTGMAPGTIVPQRASVVRGKVLDVTGNPLPGVTITILNHPEYGQTLSRADGMFDMAVNGGGQLTVNYAMNGYLSSQRQVQVPWGDFAYVNDDVALVKLDPQVTPVTFGSSAGQLASGSVQTDMNGSRQATVYFPAGTTATMVMPNGSTQPLTSGSFRATEFTVGGEAQQSMPAELPPGVAFTYAVDLSFDEAQAAGATQVTFNQPVPVYADDFLKFPVGGQIPLYVYDPVAGTWVLQSGVANVMQVIAHDSQGNAILDVDGKGAAATAAELTQLGISGAELTTIGAKYADGAKFWRWLVTHFSKYDTNPKFQGPIPAQANADSNKNTDDPNCLHGCVVNPQGQSVGENIPVTGTPFVLHYSSDHQIGYQDSHVVRVQITNSTTPSTLQSVAVWFRVAGQMHEYVISNPGPNYIVSYQWDGNDAYGRSVIGQVPVDIRVGYSYTPVFYYVAGLGVQTQVPSNLIETYPWNDLGVMVQGRAVPPHAQQAGWSINVHHAYDPETGNVFFGDGTVHHGANYTTIAKLIASQVSVDDVTVAQDGTVYFAGMANGGVYGIFNISPQGAIQTVVAMNSNERPEKLTFGPDGSLYFVTVIPTPRYFKAYRMTPDGTITQFAGSQTCGPLGGPAMQSCLSNGDFMGIAVGPDGTVYMANDTQVLSVGTDGIIRLVATVGYNGLWDLAVGPDGSVYYGGGVTYRIFRRAPDGTITTFAGTGAQVRGPDGGQANQTPLFFPTGIKVAPDGTVYILDSYYLRKITTDGIITTLAGNGSLGVTPQGVPAVNTSTAADRLALSPNGSIICSTSIFGRIYSIAPDVAGAGQNSLSTLIASGYQVASADGKKLYLFDASGRHIETLDTTTKAIIYSFGYDSNSYLTSITDLNGRVTTIKNDGNGNPTAITSPDGQVTTLTTDSNGYLSSVTDPASDTYHMVTGSNGLLQTFKDPNGNVDTYSYDGLGRLTGNTNAVGGGWSLGRTDTLTGFTVTAKSASGLTSTYSVLNPYDGLQQLVATNPDGTVDSQAISTANDNRSETAADGTVTSIQYTGDPRFGTPVLVPASTQIKTPSGLTLSTGESRSAPLSNGSNLFSFTSLTDTISVNGQNYVSMYAPATKTWTSTTPVGRKTTAMVDSLGRPVSVQLGNLAPVTFGYDALGHFQSVTSGSGAAARSTQYSYYTNGPSQGYLQSVTDSLNRTIGYQYDGAGRVSVETLSDGEQIQFGYDAAGNLTSLTPPSRPTHGFGYDGIDETQSYTPPAITGITDSSTYYEYNLDRQLTQVTRPDGQQINLAYDTGGRLSTITVPTGIYTYAYTPKGKLLSIAAPSTEALGYTWDGFLNTGETWSGPVAGSVTRTFDNYFRVTGLGVDGSSIAFGYDNDGLVTAAGAETLKRDATDGLITGTTLGTVTTAETYDGFGAPQTDATSAGSAALYNVTYARDNLGRITGKTETINGVNHSYSYGYDQQGRLSSVTQDGTQTTYGYDANGNRTMINGATVATYDDQDRMLTYGPDSYTYTANGELITKTDASGAVTYVYDALGHLLEAKLPSGEDLQYLYDGQNRRVGKEVNGTLVQGFLYQNQIEPVAELDGSGNVIQRYVYGARANVPDYIIQGTNIYRVITDQLGSPRLIVDSSTGNVIEQIDYDAWGNIINDTDPGFQPFGFAGGIFDRDTHLYHFGARDYDPLTGRWLQKDSALFAGGETMLYGYTGNDPVNLIDPTGNASNMPDGAPGDPASMAQQAQANDAEQQAEVNSFEQAANKASCYLNRFTTDYKKNVNPIQSSISPIETIADGADALTDASSDAAGNVYDTTSEMGGYSNAYSSASGYAAAAYRLVSSAAKMGGDLSDLSVVAGLSMDAGDTIYTLFDVVTDQDGGKCCP